MAKRRRLTQAQKLDLQRASRLAIEEDIGKVKSNFKRKTWIKKTNRYSVNSIKRLQRDSTNLRTNDLAEYIAASAPLHCLDGWSFLGRAIDALLHGDRATSFHLAYYAELRATMSLLAAEGVGVFKNKHYLVVSPGNCDTLSGSINTHEFTWLALEHWSRLQRSSSLLTQVIEPGGIKLADWLNAFGLGVSLQSMGHKWLKMWGLDLQEFGHDHDSRNTFSYRPTQFSPSAIGDSTATSDAVCQLWRLCAPSHSRFDLLDRHLLRISLEQRFAATTGSTATEKPLRFAIRVVRMFQELERSGIVLSESNKLELFRFLTRLIQPRDSILLTDASVPCNLQDPDLARRVIARATLLLRVATGASARLLSEAGIDASDIRFWWEPLGLNGGLWDQLGPPDYLTDLWEDADEVLTQTEHWKNSTPLDVSRRNWRIGTLDASVVLTECERIALWGLGL